MEFIQIKYPAGIRFIPKSQVVEFKFNTNEEQESELCLTDGTEYFSHYVGSQIARQLGVELMEKK